MTGKSPVLAGTIVIVSAFFLAGSLKAQGGGNIPGGIPIPVPTQPGTGQQNQNQSGGNVQQSGNVGGQGEVPDLGDLLEFNLTPEEIEIPNERLQPFVGASRQAFQDQGIAHPRSQIDPTGGGSATGGGGGGLSSFTIGPRGGAAVTGQATNGFEVARMGLRTRLVPNFSLARPVDGQVVSTRFEQRLNRLPVAGSAFQTVRIGVENRTAILEGTVSSAAERERIERLARLEPGIDRIDNRIVVGER